MGQDRTNLQQSMRCALAATCVSLLVAVLGDSGEDASPSILVMGSSGLIGSALVEALEAASHAVIGVDIAAPPIRRYASDPEGERDGPSQYFNLDLRKPESLATFDGQAIRFVFFLACDVGGSKYIDNSPAATQRRILQNNLELFQTVLPWLQSRQLPFIYTSSYLQNEAMPYGTVKRLGEMWVRHMELGRTVRLWNIFGFQPVGLRSHVLNDWISACTEKENIQALTDGLESRQFLHVNDTAAGLIAMMDNFASMPEVTDMSSGVWLQLRDLGEAVIGVAKQHSLKCVIEWSAKSAKKRKMPSPTEVAALHAVWRPRVSLEDGISDIFSAHQDQTINKRARDGGGMCSVNQDCREGVL